MKKYKVLLSLVFLLVLPFAISLDECKGTIQQDESPCFVLLPSELQCKEIHVTFFYNGSNLAAGQGIMSNYTAKQCNVTFNYTELGTYAFNYSTGDTGSIIIEEGFLNFFNLLVFVVFVLIGGVLLFVSNHYKDASDRFAQRMLFAILAAVIFVLMGAIILTPGYSVITGVSLIIDADHYLSLLSFSLGLYCLYLMYKSWADNRPAEALF